MSRFTTQDAARFWAKVVRRGADDCWLWTASLAGKAGHQYGQFVIKHPDGTPRKGLHLYAHRVSWELANGPVPDGASVLHRCDTPRCVNPEHLFLGDQDANMKDAAAKGRLHAPRPSARKLTDSQIDEMVALSKAGVKQLHLAHQFGVTKSFVSLVLSGKRRQLRDVARKEAA